MCQKQFYLLRLLRFSHLKTSIQKHLNYLSLRFHCLRLKASGLLGMVVARFFFLFPLLNPFIIRFFIIFYRLFIQCIMYNSFNQKKWGRKRQRECRVTRSQRWANIMNASSAKWILINEIFSCCSFYVFRCLMLVALCWKPNVATEYGCCYETNTQH